MMKIDLSGRWQVYLDASKSPAPPNVFPDEMQLPGTTSAAGLGPVNPARETYFSPTPANSRAMPGSCANSKPGIGRT